MDFFFFFFCFKITKCEDPLYIPTDIELCYRLLLSLHSIIAVSVCPSLLCPWLLLLISAQSKHFQIQNKYCLYREKHLHHQLINVNLQTILMMFIVMMKTTMLDVIGMMELVVTMKCQIGMTTVKIVNVLNSNN